MDSDLVREPVDYDGAVVFEKAVSLGHEQLQIEASRVLKPNFYSRKWCRGEDLKVTLKSLGIEPFTAESVLKYKERMDNRLFWRNIVPMTIEATAPGMFAGFVGSFWMLFLGSILVISGTPISSWCGCLGLLILALFSAGLGLIVLIDSGKVTQLIIRWERKDVVYH